MRCRGPLVGSGSFRMPLSPRLRLARAWFLLFALAGPLVFTLGASVQTASAAAAKKKKSTKKSKKKSKKRSTKRVADTVARPQLRPAKVPASVSDLWSGESSGLSDGSGDAPTPAADDLDAIAAQYQVEIATGKVGDGGDNDGDDDDDEDAEEMVGAVRTEEMMTKSVVESQLDVDDDDDEEEDTVQLVVPQPHPRV